MAHGGENIKNHDIKESTAFRGLKSWLLCWQEHATWDTVNQASGKK